MKLLYNDSNSPAFNLALEEYMLTQQDQDIIMLWINSPAVIIGINQNAREEIDFDFVEDNGITIIRRQSGGGAVFHDLGNINFTVIHGLGEDDFNNYQKFTTPIVEFLKTLGVDSRLQGRNDLLIKDMKFSGNAQAVRGGRIMHHGTLLFDTDFSSLSGALKPHTAKIESKGIKSVRSRVTNIAEHLPNVVTTQEFLEELYDFYLNSGLEEYKLSEKDLAATRQLVEDKYGTWEWNIGKSPAYDYQHMVKYPYGLVELQLQADAGTIRSAKIFGDFFGTGDIGDVEKKIVGLRHEKEEIAQAFADVPLEPYISGMSFDDFLELFLG